MTNNNKNRLATGGLRCAMLAGLVCAGAVLSPNALAQSNFNFEPGMTLDTQGLPEVVAVGDIDGDGRDDLAVVNNTYSTLPLASHVLIYLQQADGTLAIPLTVPFDDQGVDAWGLELVNLDDDDALEVVAGYYRSLLLVDYDAQSGLVVQTVSTPNINDSLHSQDVNRDGLVDVLALQDSGQARYLSIFYNQGTGAVSSPDVIDVSGAGGDFDLAVADLNGDGIDDLALMNGGSSSFPDLSVFLHDGVSGFLPRVSYDDQGFELARGLVAADINADGLSDVLLSLDAPGGNFNRVYLQNEAGELIESGPLLAATTGAPVETFDLDGNGLNDLIYGYALDNSLAFSLRSTSGFDSEQLVAPAAPFEQTREPIALGDLNADDCTDVATADYFTGVTVLYGDGCVASADLGLTLRARFKRARINARHLGGDAVNDALVSVSFSGDQPFLLSGPSNCVIKSSRFNRYFAECDIGPMQAGEKDAFMFELNNSPNSTGSATVTIDATIGSSADDPNPGNNEASIVIAL